MVYFVWYILSGIIFRYISSGIYCLICFLRYIFFRYVLSGIYCPVCFVPELLSDIFCPVCFVRICFVQYIFVRPYFVHLSFILVPARIHGFCRPSTPLHTDVHLCGRCVVMDDGAMLLFPSASASHLT